MPQTQELKAQMLTAAEEIINELLAETAQQEDLRLGDIERLVRAAGEEVMVRLTAQLVEAEGQQAVSESCPDCGGKMRYKGKKGRNLITETGEVRLERGYYYCPTCRQGIFPPGPTVGGE